MRRTLSASVLATGLTAARLSADSGGSSPCGARYVHPCGARPGQRWTDLEGDGWAGAVVLGDETVALACRNEDVVRLYRASDLSCGVGENTTSASEWLTLEESATAAARVGDSIVVSTYAVDHERGNNRARIEIFPDAALPGAGAGSSATTLDVDGRVSVLAALADGDFVAGNRDGWVDQFHISSTLVEDIPGPPWQMTRKLNVGAEVLSVAEAAGDSGVLAVGTRDSGVFLYAATEDYPFAQILAGAWIPSVIAFNNSYAVADYEASQVRLVSLDGVIYRNLSVGLKPWRLSTIPELLEEWLAVSARDGSFNNVHLYTSDAIATCPLAALCTVEKTLNMPGPVEDLMAFGPEYNSDGSFVHMGLAVASGGWVGVRSTLGTDERAEVLTGVDAVGILQLGSGNDRHEFAVVGGRKVVRAAVPRARTVSGPNSNFELPPWKTLQASGPVQSLARIQSEANRLPRLAAGTSNGFVDLFDPFAEDADSVRYGALRATGEVRGLADLDGGGLAALDVTSGDFPDTEVLLFDAAAVEVRGAAIGALPSPTATFPATLDALTLNTEGASIIVGGAFFIEVFDVPDLTNPPRLPRTKLASPARAVVPLGRGGIAAAGLPEFTALFDSGAVAASSTSAQEPYVQLPYDASALVSCKDGLVVGGSGGVFLVHDESLDAGATAEADWLRASTAMDQRLLALEERRELLQISGSMIFTYNLAAAGPPTPSGGSTAGLWWAVGVLVVVLVAGALLWFFFARLTAATAAQEGNGPLEQSLQPATAQPSTA